MNNTYKISSKLLYKTDSNSRVNELLDNVQGDFGFIPNMYEHMRSHSPMLESYLSGVSIFRNESRFNLVEQEIIFLTLSVLNKCDYCTSSHSLISVSKAKMPLNILREVCECRGISDSKLNTLQEFVMHMYERKGAASVLEVNSFLDAGYSEVHILSIIHAIALKTLSNYSNHLFGTKLDSVTKKWIEKKEK